MSVPHPGRTLIPNPFDGEEAHARFQHRDLPRLSAEALWAERLHLEIELARRLTRRERPRIVVAWPKVIDEHMWLVARLERLDAERRVRTSHVA
jgi:hypothetical protein